jgi:DNA-binding transcriptional LysR family regulator
VKHESNGKITWLRLILCKFGGTVKLLNRTTRSVSLTEAGAVLLERIAPAFEEVSSAVHAVQALHTQPAGIVRLNMWK